MPTYEYRCPKGHTFEIFQRMADAPVERCQVCGAAPVEKVLFPVAVHFKGSGFYSTDYGRGSRKDVGKDGDGATGSSETKETKVTKETKDSSTPSTDSSSETKPDKKKTDGD